MNRNQFFKLELIIVICEQIQIFHYKKSQKNNDKIVMKNLFLQLTIGGLRAEVNQVTKSEFGDTTS